MPDPVRTHPAFSGPRRLRNAAGLSVEVLANGSIRRIECGGVTLNLFIGNEAEAGPANLWLRWHAAGGIQAVPLLGPLSPLALQGDTEAFEMRGEWRGLRLQLQLRLAASAPAWFWHLRVENLAATAQTLDLLHVQDIGLASYAAIRLNEHYVSHYLDLSPLEHADRGCVLAARQNLAVGARHPWLVTGSLRRGTAFATDALQVYGLAVRSGQAPAALEQGLGTRRLQHEHALLAIQDETLSLAPGQHVVAGFFACFEADHVAATTNADLALVDATLALPEARPPMATPVRAGVLTGPRSMFATAPMLPALDLDAAELDTLFGPARRHEEFAGPTLLSFFRGADAHVVLRAKELRVQRPHGHILRSGAHLMPDENALTSTVWMAGVFHSMVTQGHVSINRILSTAHSWLGLFRSHGQRVFVQIDGAWQLLGVPSAFEIEPTGCRWIYKHAGGVIEVRSQALDSPHALGLQMRVVAGSAVRLLVTHHVALGGDDGNAVPPLPLPLQVDAGDVFVGVPAGSELATRFPGGGFRIEPAPGTHFEHVGGDEMLFDDGASRSEPFVCIGSGAVEAFGLRIVGRLLEAVPAPADEAPLPQLTAPAGGALTLDVARLADILPWYRHNALVHYLAPRGLEQYSGGGWGTRDVCQGPLEMLLALDRAGPVRDLLLRVFAAQNADGDWPQWFMFFERDRHIRAGDSHGDIVFWPLLGLAQYLLASEDAALLDLRLPFFTAPGATNEEATLWQHVERALAVIRSRRIEGTHLVAYGHGDWNDSLQPADPALRERLCSAWTVTLHQKMLATLARALHGVGRDDVAATLQAESALVQADFQRLLLVDGVVTGYALFPPGQPQQLLLHPGDRLTGVHYSLLPMMHAILDDMLSPAQAQAHLALIGAQLSGPDGARLFDRPLPYRGGPEQLFQRAESSAFFGREIGLMYMHAHLRYAQMLAHLGKADQFFDALCKAHPLGLRERVPSASLRQANCYFSSTDAAFADRYDAERGYGRIADGSIALDGGWRIYSSGPGIAIGLVVGSLLGIRRERSTLVVDPVMPVALDGLRARLPLAGRVIDVVYRLGREGCGPTRLELNGIDVPFARGPNPYRTGAAEVAMTALEAQLTDADNTLIVHTG
jgi:cellobiose phosphorylase